MAMRGSCSANLLGRAPPRYSVAPTQMLLRADESHVWCWERESPSPCLAHPAPAPRFPCGAITFTRRRRTALRFQAPEPSAPAKGEQGRKPAATRRHTARSAPLVRTRPPTRGLAPLHLHILVRVTLRSHSRLLVRYSFSSGGHESSNALAVLLSRFDLSLVVLLALLLILGARLLVLRLRVRFV